MARVAANDNQPQGAAIRFTVEPRLVPPAKAARRLHLTLAEFEAKRAALHRHGFPLPVPVVEHFDLQAIDAWLNRMSCVEQESPSQDSDADFERRLAAIG